MKTSQSSQSVAITPISNPCNDIPDHVSINGEICFLLPEIKLNDLKRICGNCLDELARYFKNNPFIQILIFRKNAFLLPENRLHAICQRGNAYAYTKGKTQ